MINPHPFPLPPNAIQSDGGRNPIGHRTEHDDFSCAFSAQKPHLRLTFAEHVRY